MSILTAFLRHPLLTGAVAASSPALARMMTAGIGPEQARTVVELGPGTGVFTDAIRRRVAPGTRIVAVELNGHLAEQLTRRYRGEPVEIVHGSATDLATLVTDPVDVIVSGLPWTVMAEPVRRRILDAVTTVLAPSGVFTTFAYAHAAWTPPGRRFAGQLRERFGVTGTSRVVWRNLPPAFVHQASVPLRPVSPPASRPDPHRREQAPRGRRAGG
ncbi:class I SAM-dependent methyltransferase [Actinoplanes sp. HUAS TT8]|uniref:class I SAM-dependent methyltransferase n=1 Tax=Actinoplanes sp. HUAS TT8 TaxID=3447453 RepID=UPI003F51F577